MSMLLGSAALARICVLMLLAKMTVLKPPGPRLP
jgi:hypothetical protein